MPDRDLIERRRAAADAEFEGYDFGSISIAAADGWQFTMPGNQVHRAIYIEDPDNPEADTRTADHTSDLQSLMRISYAVFCLKKKKTTSAHTKPQDKNTNTTLS